MTREELIDALRAAKERVRASREPEVIREGDVHLADVVPQTLWGDEAASDRVMVCVFLSAIGRLIAGVGWNA